MADRTLIEPRFGFALTHRFLLCAVSSLVADPGRSVMSARFRLPAGRSYNVRATELERDRQHTQVVCNVLLLDNTVQAFKVNVSKPPSVPTALFQLCVRVKSTWQNITLLVCFLSVFSITLKLSPDEDVLMKTVVSSALSFFRIENFQHQTPSPFSQTNFPTYLFPLL